MIPQIFSVFAMLLLVKCGTQTPQPIQNKLIAIDSTQQNAIDTLVLGAERLGEIIPKLQGKKIALVVNQSSTVGDKHLVDTLIKFGLDIQFIMAPEHGFRGTADAGELINTEKDKKTGLTIKSLYGKTKKPSPQDMANIDAIVFDIQDVGVRFYTYISTLHYLMDACAEYKKELIVLDRPNPNGHYIDGPILDPAFKSFVGMHPVPVVHGMTIGEYAQMINGEGWLTNGLSCNLDVVKCKNYTHQYFYELPIKPSPNLPNPRSIYLYPSTCWFEGTNLSLGRGTDKPFQIFGHPKYIGDYTFTPQSNEGAKDPPLKGQICRGIDLTEVPIASIRDSKKIDLSYLIKAYEYFEKINEPFFLENNFIDKLAGSDQLRKQILAGKTEKEIRATWQPGLEGFAKTRAKYLLYPEN
jgi:uncharacterized protein YbbC (DUF1343 family)